MRRSDFFFDLPENLIAQQPLGERGGSRMLCVDGETGARQDRMFGELGALLEPGDLLVLNDTRVIPARLYGRKQTGGRVECLIERLLDEHRALVHLRASRSPGAGARLDFDGGGSAEVLGRGQDLFELRFDRPLLPYLEQHGHVPLPPYIHRADTESDRRRYQTVYATQAGAVAAPTAGLHFETDMLEELGRRGIEVVSVTLHVGSGTFQPVRVEDIEDHVMHSEYVVVDQGVCASVAAARARGGRVVAVGTTAVRSLETAAREGELRPFEGDTDIFIYPGYEFRVVDALLTNFHLPESTLLMLVCAFAGYRTVMAAYAHAVEARYRFFSYGDAMFLTRRTGAGPARD